MMSESDSGIVQVVTSVAPESFQRHVSEGDVLIIGGEDWEVVHVADERHRIDVQGRKTDENRDYCLLDPESPEGKAHHPHTGTPYLADVDDVVWVANANGSFEVLCPHCSGAPNSTLLSGKFVECGDCHNRWEVQ